LEKACKILEGLVQSSFLKVKLKNWGKLKYSESLVWKIVMRNFGFNWVSFS
jgi:hypothetical protein